MEIVLPGVQDTARLGSALAAFLTREPLPVFFRGGLGAGKTTLIRFLVARLPGGEAAEAASPSFNLCNLYPTTPPVAHFDLYRQEEGMADESLLDFLDDGLHVVLVEWAERLPACALPPLRIECLLSVAEGKAADGGVLRSARVNVFGLPASAANALLDAVSGGNMK